MCDHVSTAIQCARRYTGDNKHPSIMHKLVLIRGECRNALEEDPAFKNADSLENGLYLRDADFGAYTFALRMFRTAEIFRWEQVHRFVDGLLFNEEVQYIKDWGDDVDPDVDDAEHRNPMFKTHIHQEQTDEIMVGDFYANHKLSQTMHEYVTAELNIVDTPNDFTHMYNAIDKDPTKVTIFNHEIPEGFTQKSKTMIGNSPPEGPEIGNFRILWSVVPPQKCTMLGEYVGDGQMKMWDPPKIAHSPRQIGLIKAGHLSMNEMMKYQRQTRPLRHSAVTMRQALVIVLVLTWSLLFHVTPELVYLPILSRMAPMALQLRGFGSLIYGTAMGLVTYVSCASIGWLEHHPFVFGLTYVGAFVVFYVFVGHQLIFGASQKKAD